MKKLNFQRSNDQSLQLSHEDLLSMSKRSSTSCPPQFEQKNSFSQNESILFSWGLNKDGELSLGKLDLNIQQKDGCINIPLKVKGLLDQQPLQISSGGHHSACVTQQGNLLICGSYLHGKLGLGKRTSLSVTKFTQIPKLQDQKIKQAALGDYHTICLFEDGTIYSWGGSLNNKLGRRKSMLTNLPGLVAPLKTRFIMKISCGDFHILALEDTGQLWAWGGGNNSQNKGQCGIGNNENIEKPELIKFFENKRVSLIAAGGYHSLAYAGNDYQILYSWGSGIYGEIGIGEYADINLPRIVKLGGKVKNKQQQDEQYYQGMLNTYNEQIVKITAGGHHTLVLTSKNRLFAFGFGAYGQLGIIPNENYSYPKIVKNVQQLQIQDIVAGWNHSLLLTKIGEVYSTGYGKHGQLGHGNFDSKVNFTKIEALCNYKIEKVFAGGNHSWALIQESSQQKLFNKSEELPEITISKVNINQNDVSSAGESSDENEQEIIYNCKINNFQYPIQVYLNIKLSQTNFVHRFIRMEVMDLNIAKFEKGILNYIQQVQENIKEEQLLHYNLKKDNDIYDQNGSIVCKSKGKNQGQNYTLLMIFDVQPTQDFDQILAQISKETEIIAVEFQKLSSQQKFLSRWAKQFYQMIRCLIEGNPKFLELRPLQNIQQNQQTLKLNQI